MGFSMLSNGKCSKVMHIALLIAFLKLFRVYLSSKCKRKFKPGKLHPDFFASDVDGLWIHWKEWRNHVQNPSLSSPRSVFFILHGFGDHIGRYTHIAQFLQQRGYDVYAHDHRGHGRSDSPNNFGLGYIDSYEHVIKDSIQFIQSKMANYSEETNFYLLGHSFGGLMASHVVQSEKLVHRFSGVILTSPLFCGTKALETFRSSKILMGVLTVLSKVLPFLRLGVVETKTLCTEEIIHDHLAHDVLALRAMVPVRSSFEMIRGSNDIFSVIAKAEPSSLPPLLLLHGSKDELTSATRSREFFDTWSGTDKQFVSLEKELHELLNEEKWTNHLSLIVDWARLKSAYNGDDSPGSLAEETLHHHAGVSSADTATFRDISPPRKSNVVVQRESVLANKFRSAKSSETVLEDYMHGSPGLKHE